MFCRGKWERVQTACLIIATVLLGSMTIGLAYEALLLCSGVAFAGIVLGYLMVEGLHLVGTRLKKREVNGFRITMVLLVMSLHSVAEGLALAFLTPVKRILVSMLPGQSLYIISQRVSPFAWCWSQKVFGSSRQVS